jgi:hypothetical protein
MVNALNRGRHGADRKLCLDACSSRCSVAPSKAGVVQEFTNGFAKRWGIQGRHGEA